MSRTLGMICALVCVWAAPTRGDTRGQWRVMGLAPRGIDPRALDVGARLAWLQEQADFLESRYPSTGLVAPTPSQLTRRSRPDIEPFDVAPIRWKRSAPAEKRAETTIGLQGLYSVSQGQISDTAYLAGTSIGTPAQSFLLQVDTGSAQCWLAAPKAVAQSQVTKNTFSPASSSSWRQVSSALVNLTYGSGAVQGILGTETISLGGLELPGQSLLVAEAVSSTFVDTLFDGLLGMALQGLSLTGQPVFFDNLVSLGKLSSPVFSLYLTRAADNATVLSSISDLTVTSAATAQGLTNGGEMVLGGYDSSRFTGSLTYVPLLSQTYWLVQMDSVYVNGEPVTSSRIPAAIDSGTSLSILPLSVATALAQTLGGEMVSLASSAQLSSTFLAVPCDAQVAEIAFGFGGRQFNLNITDLSLGVADSTGTTCILGILGRNVPSSASLRSSNIAVIGDNWLKSVVSVFSLAGVGSVGFATALDSASATASLDLSAGQNASATNAAAASTPTLSGTPSPSATKSGAARLTVLWRMMLVTISWHGLGMLYKLSI